MVVKGYYIWCKKQDGNFITIFLPTTDFSKLSKYVDEFEDITYVYHIEGEKKFAENEKQDLFCKMLEINNL